MNARTFSTRPIAPHDFAAWKILWAGYNAFYGRSDATALPEEIIHTTWQRFFDRYEPVYCIVAEREGALLGLAHYLFHRSTIRIESTCYLQDLFTVQAARGQGVGAALIDAVCAQAQASGAQRVYWHTRESNHVARRVYDKVGENFGVMLYQKNLQNVKPS